MPKFNTHKMVFSWISKLPWQFYLIIKFCPTAALRETGFDTLTEQIIFMAYTELFSLDLCY